MSTHLLCWAVVSEQHARALAHARTQAELRDVLRDALGLGANRDLCTESILDAHMHLRAFCQSSHFEVDEVSVAHGVLHSIHALNTCSAFDNMGAAFDLMHTLLLANSVQRPLHSEAVLTLQVCLCE